VKPTTQDRGYRAAGMVLAVVVLIVVACVAATLVVWLLYVTTHLYGD
jgi:hypothetical protein